MKMLFEDATSRRALVLALASVIAVAVSCTLMAGVIVFFGEGAGLRP
jgi:hypothetical protein